MKIKPDKPLTKPVVVLMYPADHKRLEKLAKRIRVSVGEFIRQAVEEKIREVGENGN